MLVFIRLKENEMGILPENRCRVVEEKEFHFNGPKISFDIFDHQKNVTYRYKLVYLCKFMQSKLGLMFRRRGNGQKTIGVGIRKGIRFL